MSTGPDLGFTDSARTVVLVASGPSAADADLELARGWPVLVVNDAWRLAPWARALYACDPQWWDVHHAEVSRSFAGELWTQDEMAARRFGLRRIAGKNAPGLSTDPGMIHFNGNSGAQAINLAFLWGARRLILVGYDMGRIGGREHFFGPHPEPLRNTSPYDSFIKGYRQIARDCVRLGLEVINTSPVSRLDCFARMPFTEAMVK